MTRFVALWVPNWPLTSLVVQTPPGTAAATFLAGRVDVVTPTAQSCGVQRGMTRKLAQYHCRDLVVLDHDKDRESAAFEAVIEAFDNVAAGVTIVRPGLAFTYATAPSRMAGSEDKLVEDLVEEVALDTGAECQVGIASGLSAALLAARAGKIIPEGQTKEFLAQLSLKELICDLPATYQSLAEETLETLSSLGVRKVDEYVSLGHSAIVSRFGKIGQVLWDLAVGNGFPVEPTERNHTSVEVSFNLDPPALLVEQAATAIARISADLSDRLRQRSLYSSTISVTLESSAGRFHERTWTMLDATNTLHVAKRIGWQIRGWLDGVAVSEEPDSLSSISLVAVDSHTNPVPDALWGGVRSSWKASQAVEQVQTLLGESSVVTPIVHGGFDPRTKISLTPWGLVAGVLPSAEGAWEGAVEDPPVIVYADPPAALLLGERNDGTSGRIWVGLRGALNGIPQRVIVEQSRSELDAGDHPLGSIRRLWVVRGRWWRETDELHQSRCFLRVGRVDGTDLLLVQRKGVWFVEGLYGT